MATLNDRMPEVTWYKDVCSDKLFIIFRDYYGSPYAIPILQDASIYKVYMMATATAEIGMRREIMKNISNWAITELAKMELEQ